MAKSKNRVGLDVGSQAIKMVEMAEPSSSNPRLSCFGSRRIDNPSKESLAASIKALAYESKVSSKEVNISVSGSSVTVRFVTMPKMKEEDLKGAIRFEAERHIPFNIDDCIVDFQILKRYERDHKLDILLAAAKKGYVEERIKIIEDAGFSVSLVDVDTFALANSFLRNFQSLEHEKTLALLNIGATFTNLAIVRDGLIHFARDMAIGGNDFNDAISKGLNVELSSAEEVKVSPKEKADAVIGCTKAGLSKLLDEAQLSFDYYENQYGRPIDAIHISGGSANLIGLEKFFQDALGSKPNLWNPFQFLDTTSSAIDSNMMERMKNSFAVAVGLALR